MQIETFQTIFNTLFFKSLNTRLVNGLDIGVEEPVYLPATSSAPAQIIFAHGFLSSALHEVAHWCYAGPERRQLPDYGYWYAGDNRTAVQQEAFEQVELIPQAYELLLSRACGHEFKVSLDNFNHQVPLDRDGFFEKVQHMAALKLKLGVSHRLQMLLAALNRP